MRGKAWRMGMLAVMLAVSVGSAAAGTIDPGLELVLAERGAGETVSALVFAREQVDLVELKATLDSIRAPLSVRHETVVRMLQGVAQATQGNLRDHLKQLELAGRIQRFDAFWIANVFRVDATPADLRALAQHPDVETIYYNYEIETIQPIRDASSAGDRDTRTPTSGLIAVRAPEVWALGFTGTDILVATLDTGVDGNHPALASRWRGVADPRYAGHPQWAWFDPVTNTTFPAAFGAHGTHTMGTVCGGPPGQDIGVAPGAQWIHAAVIDRVSIPQTVADAIAAFQWMIDPDGDPMTHWDVPHVCSNSWGVTTGHGYPPCDQTFWTYIDACEAAGIVQLFSAGNEGPSANSLRRPADRATTAYNCLAVAAVDANQSGWPIADFSSRGPTNCTPNGAPAIKPDIAAPGVNVYSSIPGGGYDGSWSGTSMASPHVNGVVALVREACPDLLVDEVKQILYETAHDLGAAGEDNSYGWGMVDAYEAVQIALSMCSGAPRARDVNVQTPVNTPIQITLDATDYDHLPDPPGALTFIVTTLPAGGNTLTDVGNGHLIVAEDLPYSLVNYGNQVLYTPATDYYGTDTFQFKANDGGEPPDAGDSNIATVSILVLYPPPVIITDSLPPGLLNGLYGPVQLEASLGQPPMTWTVLPEGEYFETDLGSNLFQVVGTAQNWHADDQYWTYALPFPFPYFGVEYTTAYVCSNGFINFGTGSSSYSNSDSELIAAKRIAAMWDDLRTDGTGQDIFIDASVPGEVTFRWAGQTYSGGYPCNFSIVLFADGRIQFRYGSGNTGLSPTIGVSNGDGTHYRLSMYNNSSTLTNANTVQFVMPASLPDGVTLSPAGVLSGIPTEAGLFQPTFKVTDALTRSHQRTLDLQINIGPIPPIAYNQDIIVPPNTPQNVTLVATDDGLPNPPGALEYIINTLPAHGRLFDPASGHINSAPYTLLNGGSVVTYHPGPYHIGADSFTFKANDGGTPPDGGDSNIGIVNISIPAIPGLVYSYSLDASLGWATEAAWAFGHPTGGGTRNRDPNNGHTGANVYGYNLAGDYANNLSVKYLTTTPIYCANVTQTSVKFWRWLGVEQFDRATIEVSNNGTDWVSLWVNPSDAPIADTAWVQQSLDIASVADNQATVYLRWGMGPTDSSVTYPGWNIDDVEIWGIARPIIVGDVNCDGEVDFGDINAFVLALTNPDAYAAQYPECPFENRDINGNGTFGFDDINPFVALLTAGS